MQCIIILCSVPAFRQLGKVSISRCACYWYWPFWTWLRLLFTMLCLELSIFFFFFFFSFLVTCDSVTCVLNWYKIIESILNMTDLLLLIALCSAGLRCRADWLHSVWSWTCVVHGGVTVHEWLAFYSAPCEYPPKWCTYSATWLTRNYCLLTVPHRNYCLLTVPHDSLETTAFSARSVYTIQPCKATNVMCMRVACNLTPALSAEWLGSFTCYYIE